MTNYSASDILQLKTGGVAMTAGEFDPKRGRRCAWLTKDDVKEKYFSDEMLQPYEEDRIAAIRVSIVDSYEPQFKAALELIAGGAKNPQEIAAGALKDATGDLETSLPSRS